MFLNCRLDHARGRAASGFLSDGSVEVVQIAEELGAGHLR